MIQSHLKRQSSLDRPRAGTVPDQSICKFPVRSARIDVKGRSAVAVFIHRKSQFDKCLYKLRQAGGRSACAAERAEAIIATLTSTPGMPEQVNRLTKFGERRISGCKKYDLGSGYRLVYVKEAEHYVFLFVGTHDDCDRWLTNNKYLQDLQLDTPEDVVRRAAGMAANDTIAPPTAAGCACEVDYDDMLMQKIDEPTLRRIFRGLCGD